MARLLQTVAALEATILFGFAVAATMACSARPLHYDEDFTEAVEYICADYCQMNLACREPPAFESYEACEDICLGSAYVYNDTDCGQALRDVFECIGSTPTCELFDDTYNVHADEYTCKIEKNHWVSLDCGKSDEDPFPVGTP
jgi:hypothetical protein